MTAEAGSAPAPVSSSRRGWTLAAAVCAALAGLLAAAAPVPAVLAVAALVLTALMVRAGAATFGVCLFILAYSPEYLGPQVGVLNRPELQKGVIYFALLAMLAIRGVRARLLLPLVAYVALAVLAYLYGDLIAGLTLGQMASSYVTLTAGWLGLAIRWQWSRDVRYLKALSFLPIACVVLGLGLQAVGLHDFYGTTNTFDTVSRLQAASIAAQLALTAFVACSISYVLWRAAGWRWGPWLAAANAVILALTVSRGAAVALGIAALWPALRFGLEPVRSRPRIALVRLGVLAISAAVVVATIVPVLAARNTGGLYVAGQGTITDPTSGRLAAWKQFYAIAKQSPVFGHGLGSGPITKIQEQGFLAQHNEYLRLFLEGGYLGGGLVLLAIVLVIALCVRQAPRRLRADLIGVVLAFAFLSFTDNTLTSVNLTIPFCLLLGICASRAGADTPGPEPDTPPGATAAVTT